MNSNSTYFWFFIIGGFLTAAVGIGYFAVGGSDTATAAQDYSILLQIPLGTAVTVYGIKNVDDRKRS